MKIENQVVGLELAKQLKELGVKQDSIWYWTWAQWNEEVEWVLIPQDEIHRLKKEYFSAYTVAELGEMLPNNDNGNGEYVTIKTGGGEWIAWEIQKGLFDSEGYYIIAKTEADARAKMLISLIKAKTIKGQ